MKKIRMISISIVLSLVIILTMSFIIASPNKVFADVVESTKNVSEMEVESNTSENEGQSLQSVFKSKVISTCEYVYNLDGNADYIYVDFENSGYALFSTETMEMMEYSLQRQLPYSDSASENYYAGPSNYLKKSNNQFVDLITGEKLNITKAEISKFSQQTRESLVNDKQG